jgi:hypothetical protein
MVVHRRGAAEVVPGAADTLHGHPIIEKALHDPKRNKIAKRI